MKAWGGRFTDGERNLAVEFGRSIEVDQRLALDDIAGSVAHVRGLERAGLLTADESRTLVPSQRNEAAGRTAERPADTSESVKSESTAPRLPALNAR